MEEKCGLLYTKIVGTPFIYNFLEHPTDNSENHKNQFLYFFAQLNLNNIPPLTYMKNNGILQFYIAKEFFGAKENIISLDGIKVIHHSSIRSVNENQYLKKIFDNQIIERSLFPEISMRFSPYMSNISPYDYRFKNYITSVYKEINPTITSYFDIPVEFLNKFNDYLNVFESKIGGYPVFIKEDPRENNDSLQKYTNLLFQINLTNISEQIKDNNFSPGIISFFISEDDLKHNDFKNILYYWESYKN